MALFRPVIFVFRGVLNWFLNINTIWGLLILTAFVLCAAQHYMPTKTSLPASVLQPGENILVIQAMNKDGEAEDFEFTITRQGKELVLEEEALEESEEEPYFKNAEIIGDRVFLTWDHKTAGDYVVRIGRQQELESGAMAPGMESRIPMQLMHRGRNILRLVYTTAEGEEKAWEVRLPISDRGVSVPENALAESDERPWISSISREGTEYLLGWNSNIEGSYRMALAPFEADRDQIRNLSSFTDAAFDYAEIGFELALGLVAAMVLFLGLMRVGEDAGIVNIVARVFYPVIRFLFPEVPKDHPANGAILMNVTTTVLGLGNAATPFGLKAIKELQSLNPNGKIATDSQVMLLAYNTAGLALLPTTLIALRKSAGTTNPFEIIGPCLFAGTVATITAIVLAKTLGRLPVFSVAAAVREQIKEDEEHGIAEDAGNENKEDKEQ